MQLKPMIKYVAGFMFDQARSKVALIRKNRPAWQKGLLNGIGGKIDPGETPLMAMIREFREETGYQAPQPFRHYALIQSPEFTVDFFFTVGDLDQLKSITDEKIEITSLNEIHVLRKDLVENLPWLISLAIDQWDDNRPSFATVNYA